MTRSQVQTLRAIHPFKATKTPYREPVEWMPGCDLIDEFKVSTKTPIQRPHVSRMSSACKPAYPIPPLLTFNVALSRSNVRRRCHQSFSPRSRPPDRYEWQRCCGRGPAKCIPAHGSQADKASCADDNHGSVQTELEEADGHGILSFAACRTRGAALLEEFTEVESGSHADRRQLARALDLARLTGATLLIAKLDRLSRNAAFLLTLRDSGTEFVACDMPDANSVTVGIMAVIAEEERRAISARTKAALAAAKARGVKLGNPNGAAALIRADKGTGPALSAVRNNATRRAQALAAKVGEIKAAGANSHSAIAKALNEGHIRTPRGGQWYATSIRRLIARIGG